MTRWIETRITSLFGSSNARYVKRLQSKIDAIAALEPELERLDSEQLKKKTVEFRRRLAAGETLDDLLVEAFAVCREASKRVTGLRHYDVQMLGGMVLHSGAIAEMMTGEGKTLVATLPAYLNALTGKGVHVVTVNDYLARRDMEWMGPIYLSLGITVGAIQSNMETSERQKAYKCDITYGTNNEFGFDYLRDNMRYAAKGDDRYDPYYQQSQGKLHYAIVDEVDNILIDEARTPLIISGPARDDVTRYRLADTIARQLVKDVDFEVNEKEHTAHMTDAGIRKAEHLAGVESFYTAGNMEWPHLIDNSLKAHNLYKRDVNYVIIDGEIVIVDEFTGRIMVGRQWSDGLHQAVEAKEGVKVKEETQTYATITLQNFFKLYDKIAGMTGTAMTEASEFWKIYKLDVINIPTNRPLRRVNHADLIYKTEHEKYVAVVDEIERLNKWDILALDRDREIMGTIVREDEDRIEIMPKGVKQSQWIDKKDVCSISRKGRPILVGTVSIQKSELISGMLDKKGIKHQLLNAKPEYVKRESEIVAQAGRKSAVTIATNMAGRGTDIILGGNPDAMAWSMLQAKYPTRLEVPQEEWTSLIREIDDREKMKEEGEEVRNMGGLHIIGTERHEARRIDLQLRGRCGRQGDPGSTRFFLSLEDDLMRIFAGEWVKRIMTALGMEDGVPIESAMVTRRVEAAQKKVEERNFDVRKNLLEYDEVMDYQRKSVYGYRQRILDGANCKELIIEMIDEQIETHVGEFLGRDYGAAMFAQWAAGRLSIEFEPKDFRGLTYTAANEFALDQARRMAESQVLDMVEENLPEDVEDESEWNWQALAKGANTRWKTNFRDTDLKRIGRDNVAEEMIERARKYIDGVDLSEGEPLLDQHYGVKTTLGWVRQKFDIALDFEEFREMESQKFKKRLRELTHEKYREKEIRFPVLAGLLHFTVRDAQGKRYDREGLVRWAKERFDVDLSLDDLKNKQRAEIEEVMFEQSKTASEKTPAVYAELRTRIDRLLGAAGFDGEKIREKNRTVGQARAGQASAGSKFAARSISQQASGNKYTGKYSSGKGRGRRQDEEQVKSTLDRNMPELVPFCEWSNAELNAHLTPETVAEWDVHEWEDRLCSIAEDRFNPEMRKMERSLVLQILDTIWKEHLQVMDQLRSSIGLRGYAQIDPKVEFKREGMRIFEDMWNTIFERVTNLIFRMEQFDPDFVSSTWKETSATHAEAENAVANAAQEQQEAIDGSAAKTETIRNSGPKVGRNDPCPCGSGKKYKHCCFKKK